MKKFMLGCLLLLLPLLVNAQDKRVALVLGNSAYKFNTVLKNPANDATDVAEALRRAGFEVILKTDADLDGMNKAVREFGTKLKSPSAVGLFYYSGHGAQVQGKNYLIPVTADIQDADEVAYKALDAEAVLAKMESAGNALNIVILDACRNNPFPGSSRSGDRGLSLIKANLPESMIIYATEPGRVAEDGQDRNSPFTSAFLGNLTAPGLDIALMMKKVTADVRQKTGGQQSPRVDSNLTKDFMFYQPVVVAAPLQSAPTEISSSTDQTRQPAVSWTLPMPTARVEGGSFLMGRNDGEDNEAPAHRVTLSGFLMSKTLVTHAQWEAVLKKASHSTDGQPAEPLSGVTFLEALQFCNALSLKEGLTPAYQIRAGADLDREFSNSDVTLLAHATGWRLPTEAQYEYAARGGRVQSAALFAGSDQAATVAWTELDDAFEILVATKNPNGLGLYDMTGLVDQWCWDLYHAPYPATDQTDPLGPGSFGYQIQRVIRGGNALSKPLECTVFTRHPMLPQSSILTGFRVVRPLP